MRGTMVIVRDFKGEALVRRVWDADQKVVYITDDQQLEQLVAGKDALMPVGFPPEDVFEYDSGIVKLIGRKSIDWNRLKRWKDKAKNSKTRT